MKRIIQSSLTLVSALAFIGLFTLGAPVASAHGGEGLTVTPNSAMPGDTVKVHAEAVAQPNGDVDIHLVSTSGVETDLGSFKADDTGDLDADVTLPTTLEPGAYQLKALGTTTMTTDLTITAASGGTSATTAPTGTTITFTPRPLPETIGLVALFGVLAGLGLFLARTIRRPSTPVTE
jgi:hypothetical protein